MCALSVTHGISISISSACRLGYPTAWLHGFYNISDNISSEMSDRLGIESRQSSYSGQYQPPSSGYGVPQGPVLSGSGFFPGGSLYRGRYNTIKDCIKVGRHYLV